MKDVWFIIERRENFITEHLEIFRFRLSNLSQATKRWRLAGSKQQQNKSKFINKIMLEIFKDILHTVNQTK